MKTEREHAPVVSSAVERGVVLPCYQINDEEFSELFGHDNDDAVICQMIEEGWTLGRAGDGQNEYWPPD